MLRADISEVLLPEDPSRLERTPDTPLAYLQFQYQQIMVAPYDAHVLFTPII